MRASPLTVICGGYVIQITRPRHTILLVVKISGMTIKGEILMVEFKKAGQFVEFDVLILDGKGRPASVEGDLIVANSNEIAGGVFFDQTTRHGKLTCLDDGIGQITITGDANLDPNVTTPIVGILDFASNLTGAVLVQINTGPVQEPAP